MNFDDLEYDENQNLVDADGKPFTGESVTYYPDGTLRSIQEFSSGMPHGKDQEFFPDGSIEFEGLWSNGNEVTPHRRWHRNGQLAEEKEFSRYGLSRITRWDENGQIIPRRK